MKRQAAISRFFAPRDEISQPQERPLSASATPLNVSATVSWPPAASRLHHTHRKRISDQSQQDAVTVDASLPPLVTKRRSSFKFSSPDSPAESGKALALGLGFSNSGLKDEGGNLQSFVEENAENWHEDDMKEKLSGFNGELNVKEGGNCTKISAWDPGMVNFKRRKRTSAEKDKEAPSFNSTRHEKFVEKLLARTDEKGVLQESSYGECASGNEKHTPLEQQIVALKAKYPDIVLMVEVGYKYRFFGEDAETAAKVLGIFAYYSHNFLTASIPSFRLHVHVRRLVEAGYKVGVVRQTETAALKAHGANKTGPFTRELSALYTRATLEAVEYLGGSEEGKPEGRGILSSYLMCIVEQPLLQSAVMATPTSKVSRKGTKEREAHAATAVINSYDTKFGVIAVETSTGDIMYGQFMDTVTRVELEAHLISCSPTELLLASPLSASTEKLVLDYAGPASNIRVERVRSDCFEAGGSLAEVVAFYGDDDSAPIHQSTTKEGSTHGQERVNEGVEVVMAMPEMVIRALALALRYLKQFRLENVLRVGANFRPFAAHNEMILSPNAIRQLEILANNTNGDEKGSLLWLMDQTSTIFGARLLRHWVTHPLRDRVLISARLDAVCEIADSMGSVGVSQKCQGTFPGSGKGGGCIGAASRGMVDRNGIDGQGLLASTLSSLGKLPDIERGITRIFHRTATPTEFITVVQALVTAVKKLQRLHFRKEEADGMNKEPWTADCKSVQSPLLRRLLAAAASQTVSEHGNKLLSSLNTEAATSGDRLNLFLITGGRFPEVAQCSKAIEAAEQEMSSLLPGFRKLLRISNLQYSTVSGTTNLIEVPAAQRVPADWIKVLSTKKSIRYHPPSVLGVLDKLTLAKEKLKAACSIAWDKFLAEFSLHYVDFRSAVQALAGLDCLHSLAIVSHHQGYCRPEFVNESDASELSIEAGRHPVLESVMQDGFVSNNTALHGEAEYCQVITGPNMGGKSCYMRQVALIVIMAQVGSFVPARSAKMHVFDSVYTRMGASDGIQHGSSTFLEELRETSCILQNATSCSLVIIDELGRGTSTHDGVAIAYASLKYLLVEKKCLTLFVTHYPKIAQLVQEFPGHIQAYHVSYLAEEPSGVDQKAEDGLALSDVVAHQEHIGEAMKKITFLYKIVPGVASRSFGLHVARLAQIPDACVLSAAVMAAKLEKDVSAREHACLRARLSETSGTVSVNHTKIEDSDCKSTSTGNCIDDSCEDNDHTLQGQRSNVFTRKVSIDAKCGPGQESIQDISSIHATFSSKQLTKMLESMKGALSLSTSEQKVNALKCVQQLILSNSTYL